MRLARVRDELIREINWVCERKLSKDSELSDRYLEHQKDQLDKAIRAVNECITVQRHHGMGYWR